MIIRIDRFQSAWPDTGVRLDTSVKLLDLSVQGTDIGVRYGAGRWPASSPKS